MENILFLENIGVIRSAKINLNGMCVIAGENDTGKSTIGKILMALIKTHNISEKQTKITNREWKKEKEFCKLLQLLFNEELKENGKIYLKRNQKNIYEVIIGKDSNYEFKCEDRKYFDCTFIQSPFVWDLFDFFRDVRLVNDNARVYNEGRDIVYPYLLWDLYKKIESNPLPEYKQHKKFKQEIKQEITKIINGNFLKDNAKSYKFYRGNNEILLVNVATGIKQFGILQTLLNNNRITPQGFLIFDEPENHLHPTWQLKFAKILVKLSKNHIPVLVNSHSPYFIEALYKYSKKEKAKINFHLSSDGIIEQKQNNEKTMELIFEKLNQPFKEFDKLDEKNG